MNTAVKAETPAAVRLLRGRAVRCLFLAVIGVFVVGEAAAAIAPSQDLQDAEQQRLNEEFDVAVTTFRSPAQLDSIAMFDHLVASFQRRMEREPSDFDLEKLTVSLQYRARAQLNAGARDAAGEDIRALIRVQPNFEPDLTASGGFLDMFDAAHEEMVGTLEFSVLPPTATIRVDGAVLESSIVSFSVLAGLHTIVIEEPGYQPVISDVDVPPSGTSVIEESLERESAVIEVYSRPVGATVSLEGRVMGTTTGVAPRDFVPPAEAPLARPEEFSEAFIIEHLQPGNYRVEVSLDGYRSRSNVIEIPDLRNIKAKAALEPTAGTVFFDGMERDFDVVVDNLPARPRWSGDNLPSLSLPPGERAIEVSRGTEGIFFATVTVIDRREQTLRVVLKPGVAFLGFLGGDVGGVRELEGAIEEEFGALEGWEFLDRSQTAAPVLENLGLSAERLRTAATTGASDIDWGRIQAGVDQETPGSIYVLAVPSDDIYANYSDLWIWPAAPGPVQPDRRRVRRGEAGDVADFAGSVATPVRLEVPWFGALLVDVGDMVIVADVNPEAPAGTAGLLVGDRVVSIAGEDVDSVETAQRMIAGAGVGAVIAVQVQRGAATDMVEVRIDSSPAVISPFDPELVYPAISAFLATLAQGVEATTPDWVVKLNEAAVSLHAGAWQEAVGMLNAIEDAPSGPGLGRAAIDYWLGTALSALGTRYTEGAIGAFTRAAEEPDARLFHNDGPFVAPRARARLAELGGAR